MGNENKSGVNWIAMSDEIRGMPRFLQIGIGLLLSSVCAYYSVRLVLIVLGEPTSVLFDFIGLLLCVGILLIVGVVGFVTRRIVMVHILFACVSGAYIGYHILLINGNLLLSVRQIIFYTSMPLVSGVLLAQWVKRLNLLDR